MSALPYEKFADGSDATLSGNGGSITNAQTSFTLASFTGLPAGPNFRLLIGSEIILVTGYSSGSVSACTRGAEGTTGASHNDGDIVKHVLTSASLIQLATDFGRVGAYADLPTSAPFSGYTYRCNDSYYMFVWDGSAWVAYFRDQIAYVPPSGFAWKVQGTNATLDATKGFLRLYNTSATSPTDGNVYWKATPGTPYKVHMKMKMQIGSSGTADYAGFFLGRDSDGFGIMFVMRANSDVILYTVSAGMTNYSTVLDPTTTVFSLSTTLADGVIPFAVEDDGTTKRFGFHDGNGNLLLWTTRTHTQDVTPDHIGIWFNGNNPGQRDIISWREFV